MIDASPPGIKESTAVFLLTVLSIAAFLLVILAVAKLAGDSADSFADLFIFPTMPARPRGVQEEDLPRFVFNDARAFGTGAA